MYLAMILDNQGREVAHWVWKENPGPLTLRTLVLPDEPRTDGPPPETCRHTVIQSIPLSYSNTEWIRVCVSCDSTLDEAFIDERIWDYDIDYNVWIHVPEKRKGTAAPIQMPKHGTNDMISFENITGFIVNKVMYAPDEVEIVLRPRR